jgi:dolichol-phosphate mannosyltransferase
MVMIPTYNEAANIVPLITRIRTVAPDSEVIVVDDDSPDETWKRVEELAKRLSGIHLIRRIGRRGRGSAGIEGFLFALKSGADNVLEMDSDFSHNPDFIPDFVNEIKNADLVIGSRAIAGGEERGRGMIRPLITRCANIYIRLMLGIPVKDCTAGYRLFRRETLEKIDLSSMISTGPSIVQEVLYRVFLNRLTIKEIPILFVERAAGKSTFNSKIIVESLKMIFTFRFRYPYRPRNTPAR